MTALRLNLEETHKPAAWECRVADTDILYDSSPSTGWLDADTTVGSVKYTVRDRDLTHTATHLAKQKCIFEDCERITMDDVIINGEEIKLK